MILKFICSHSKSKEKLDRSITSYIESWFTKFQLLVIGCWWRFVVVADLLTNLDALLG